MRIHFVGLVAAISLYAQAAVLSSPAPASSIPAENPHAPAPVGMVQIPAGAFIMGDDLGDGATNERPAHVVFVRAFWVDTNLVSKVLWDQVRDWGLAHGYSFANQGCAKAKDHPVQKLSWFDAVKWCNARSEEEGRPLSYFADTNLSLPYRKGQLTPTINWNAGYRLPTEAE